MKAQQWFMINGQHQHLSISQPLKAMYYTCQHSHSDTQSIINYEMTSWAMPSLHYAILYLTHSTDAHVKGIRPASCPIQHLGGQFNSETSPFSLASQCTRSWGVIRCWDPLIRDTLVLDVIVGWTLLGPEITWLCGAVLGRTTRTRTEVGVWHHNN